MRLGADHEFFRVSIVRRGSGKWLVIEVEASVSGRRWTAVDEALEAGEVRRLVRWLRRIGRGDRPKKLGFTEPNLRFECLSNDAKPLVRVWFEGELRPDWATWEDWSVEDLWVDLEIPREDVATAAESLADELEALEQA